MSSCSLSCLPHNRLGGSEKNSHPLSPATLLDSGLQTGDAASSMKETQWPGLSQRLARRIQAIETLTGQTNLRCGTLWAVSRATNLHGVSQLNLPRRWCPVCYAEQSAASAAEPLVWSMRVLQTCTVHGCALVDTCGACGSAQPDKGPLSTRRHCRKCCAPLGWNARPARDEQSPLERWIDTQIVMIVQYCADPQNPLLPANGFHRFCTALRRFPERWQQLPTSLRTVMCTRPRCTLKPPVLEVLLEVAAIQHCGVMDLLTEPEWAVQAPLWAEGPLARESTHAMLRPEVPMLRMKALLSRLLIGNTVSYLPPLATILARVDIDLDQAKDSYPELIAHYQQRYAEQGTSAQLRRLSIALERALLSPSLTRSLVPTPSRVAQVRQQLAHTWHLKVADAGRVCTSALALSRLPAPRA
ncbi:hypothetical protein B1806_16390 [Metallibacterium scheffleri]|uniref:TniQ domain-containing protein n=3 Tax=Metallibacterium scheffleri TaxID=993689 RepID=A0A4S3KCP7_9GAMM|nr:TniQ family protein [Metallibacterium scheffleri]THD05978.1 hypothetical protein B1806_16390 [Metallibacterium scheffleri]